MSQHEDNFRKYSSKKELESTISENNTEIDKIQHDFAKEISDTKEMLETSLEMLEQKQARLQEIQADNAKLMQQFIDVQKCENEKLNQELIDLKTETQSL